MPKEKEKVEDFKEELFEVIDLKTKKIEKVNATVKALFINKGRAVVPVKVKDPAGNILKLTPAEAEVECQKEGFSSVE